MPYMPPEVLGLVVALGLVAGVALMFGLRIAMRRDLEPLSWRARWSLIAMLAIGGFGAWVVYQMALRSLG